MNCALILIFNQVTEQQNLHSRPLPACLMVFHIDTKKTLHSCEDVCRLATPDGSNVAVPSPLQV